MATINGTALVVLIDDVQVSCQTDSSSLNHTRDSIETTCKDATGSNKTYIPGEKDATIDVTAAYDMAATLGGDDIFSDWDAGTLVTWKWGSIAAGETYYTGSAYITDLTIEAPQNDRSTYSFTLQRTGATTKAQNPT